MPLVVLVEDATEDLARVREVDEAIRHRGAVLGRLEQGLGEGIVVGDAGPWLLSTPSSARSCATVLPIIGEPRSACSVSASRRSSWSARLRTLLGRPRNKRIRG